MNPVLVLLILIGAILLWFLLAGAFGFIGVISNKIFGDVKNAMFEEVDDEKEKADNEEKKVFKCQERLK